MIVKLRKYEIPGYDHEPMEMAEGYVEVTAKGGFVAIKTGDSDEVVYVKLRELAAAIGIFVVQAVDEQAVDESEREGAEQP